MDIGNIIDLLKNESAFQQILMGEIVSEETLDNMKGNYQCLKEFFDTPIGDPCETKTKKAIAATIIIAKEKGTLPFVLSDDYAPEQIATMVDTAFSNAKIAYKVAQGEVDTIEAAEYLIDKAASRLDALVDVAFEKGLIKKGINVATTAICSWLHVNPIPVTAVVNSIYERVEPKIREYAHKGVKLLANVAKKAVPHVVQAVTKVKTAIKEFLFG